MWSGILMSIYSIVSELVDAALAEENDDAANEGIKSIFTSIVNTEGLDIREKKSGIIDFITAGIELVSFARLFLEIF